MAQGLYAFKGHIASVFGSVAVVASFPTHSPWDPQRGGEGRWGRAQRQRTSLQSWTATACC